MSKRKWIKTFQFSQPFLSSFTAFFLLLLWRNFLILLNKISTEAFIPGNSKIIIIRFKMLMKIFRCLSLSLSSQIFYYLQANPLNFTSHELLVRRRKRSRCVGSQGSTFSFLLLTRLFFRSDEDFLVVSRMSCVRLFI
jgi:hypothetical protein